MPDHRNPDVQVGARPCRDAAESVVTYRGTVYPSQCDHMGHMNVMWYVEKFDEATWQLLRHLGFTPSRMRDQGLGMAAVEQHIGYKRELRAGDVVTVCSTVLEVKDKSIRLAHEMRNDETGEVAATADIVGVHFETAVRRARPLPPDIRERVLRMLGQDDDSVEPRQRATSDDEGSVTCRAGD